MFLLSIFPLKIFPLHLHDGLWQSLCYLFLLPLASLLYPSEGSIMFRRHNFLPYKNHVKLQSEQKEIHWTSLRNFEKTNVHRQVELNISTIHWQQLAIFVSITFFFHTLYFCMYCIFIHSWKVEPNWSIIIFPCITYLYILLFSLWGCFHQFFAICASLCPNYYVLMF